MTSALNEIWGKLTNSRGQGFVKPLDINGDGTGAFKIIGDYSSAVEEFYIQPPSNEDYFIIRIVLQLDSEADIDRAKYGTLAALTNGVKLYHEIDSVKTLLNFGGTAMKDNQALINFSSDMASVELSGANPKTNLFDLSNVGDRDENAIWLKGSTNDKLIFEVNDDFSGLIDHEIIVKGFKRIVGTR